MLDNKKNKKPEAGSKKREDRGKKSNFRLLTSNV